MGLFGFGKKNKHQVQTHEPEPKQPEISGPPHQQLILVDGQWYINPNYDPSAPKPPKVKVYGLDDDEDEKDEYEEDDDDE